MSAAPDLIVAAARAFGVSGAAAVAVRGGRIEAVGARADVLATRGPKTRVIDVPEGLVCPGFHDAHAHLGATGVARLEVDLHGLDAAGVRGAIAAAAAAREPGRWIIGRGFDPQRFPPEGVTARAFLDEAAPHHPLLVRSHDYHACAMNTAALLFTGFVPVAPVIPGGVVETDESGDATGIVREAAAVHAEAQSGDLTDEERADASAAVLPDLFAAGVTALHDMSGSRMIHLLERLDAAGRLTLPVFATLSPGDVSGAGVREAGRHLTVSGMKAFLDGALGTRTAHLLAPYEGEPDHLGIEVLPPDIVHEFVANAAAEGLPSYLHAIGDRAVRVALDALEGARGPDGAVLRHRVEHAQMVHDDDLPRFAAAGIAASVQPVHIAEDAALVPRHWGERSHEAFPLRRLVDSGAHVACGSDTPIETFDVLDGIRCAVARTGRDGTPLHPEEALTVTEAIRCYTEEAAWAVSRDGDLGRLVTGAVGSLTVLDRDVATHPDALADCRVAATVIAGDVVFARDAD